MIGCFGEPFQVIVDSAMNRCCVVFVVLQQGCDFGSEFGINSASASQVRSSIGQRKLERGMKNMFYELPAIHVGSGIHTEAVESSLRSQACPSRSSRPTASTVMPRAVAIPSLVIPPTNASVIT